MMGKPFGSDNEQLEATLAKHLPIASPLEVSAISSTLAGIAKADRENSFGEKNIVKVKNARTDLKRLASAIGKASRAMDDLEGLPLEALSRAAVGLADFPELSQDSILTPVLSLGYLEKAEQLRSALREQESIANAAFSSLPAYPSKSGRPKEQGALALAEFCAVAFKIYVGEPSKPSWDAYENTREGPFFRMVRDVFEELGMPQSPSKFAAAAVEDPEKEQ